MKGYKTGLPILYFFFLICHYEDPAFKHRMSVCPLSRSPLAVFSAETGLGHV